MLRRQSFRNGAADAAGGAGHQRHALRAASRPAIAALPVRLVYKPSLPVAYNMRLWRAERPFRGLLARSVAFVRAARRRHRRRVRRPHPHRRATGACAQPVRFPRRGLSGQSENTRRSTACAATPAWPRSTAPCDVALIAVPAKAAIEAVRACGAAGIPFCIVLSAGFRETGAAGARSKTNCARRRPRPARA